MKQRRFFNNLNLRASNPLLSQIFIFIFFCLLDFDLNKKMVYFFYMVVIEKNGIINKSLMGVSERKTYRSKKCQKWSDVNFFFVFFLISSLELEY